MRANPVIDPRLLIGAALLALVVAVVSLAGQQFVLLAMSLLAFELLVVLTAIFITTPPRTNVSPVGTSNPPVLLGGDVQARRARIYTAGADGSGPVPAPSSAPDDHAA